MENFIAILLVVIVVTKAVSVELGFISESGNYKIPEKAWSLDFGLQANNNEGSSRI